MRKCPCGERTSPDPSCDMCDGWQNNANTGWGGFHDGFLGKDFDNEEEREKYREELKNREDEDFDDYYDEE